jgi:type VI secretion system secreted protein Hcp
LRKPLVISIGLALALSFVLAGGVGAQSSGSQPSLEARVTTLEVLVADARDDAQEGRQSLAALDARVDRLAEATGPPAPTVTMFLKLTNISGESTDDRHKGEIDILSWSWGATQSATTGTGGGAGAGKVSMQDFHFTHRVDKASPMLFLACAKGKHIPEATFTVRKAGGNQSDYLVITLKDVLVSSVSPSGSGQDPTEQVTLNFAQVEVAYTEQAADGSVKEPVRAGWDLKENREV